MPAYRTPLPALFAATLQSSLNAALALDRNSAARLDRIEGRVLKLVLEGAGLELFFGASGGGIEVGLEAPESLEGEAGGEPDTTVRGTPAALFSMAASELGEGWNAPGSNVSISGDASLARGFERLFSRLDPDLEGAFSGLFGDVVGHQLAFGLRQGARRARETAGTAGDLLGEALREGARGGGSGPLVGRAEVRRFADGVDGLRDAVDRLDARIRILAESGAEGEDEGS